jgi:hypothetical protein
MEIQDKVYEVFQLLSFPQFFNIKETLSDSVNFFQSGASMNFASLFPKIYSCPICSKKNKAIKPGHFRCSECRAILSIDDSGSVFLG